MADKMIDQILKRFEGGKSIRFSELNLFNSVDNWISTGDAWLDLKLNTYGYPTGLIEIRGLSKSGKTTASLQALKNFQGANPNNISVILSTERRDNKIYAEDIGIDTERVIIHQLPSIEYVFIRAEQTIDAISELWETNKLPGAPKFFFVWDSLGGSISESERKSMKRNAKEDEFKNTQMMAAAKASKLGMRYMQGELYDKDITFIIINHTYDNDMGGKKSYGGTGIEYMPTMRLNMEKAFQGGDIKSGEDVIGQKTLVKVVKSDFNSSTEKIEIEIGLGLGFVLSPQDIKLGVDAGLLKVKGYGASFMNGKMEWKNRLGLYQLYADKNPLLKILQKKLIEYVRGIVREQKTGQQ